MQPIRLEKRPALRLLGIQRRLDPQTTNWEKLWRDDYAPHLPEIQARSRGETCMGAYMSGGDDGLVEFLAGRPAQDGIDVPPGLIVRELPAATYAVFECAMADIGATWHAIYGDWLPGSDYLTDGGKACLEEFAPGCHEGRTPVRILVPVMRRS
jgi:predicted transcriptional regulator YdeE